MHRPRKRFGQHFLHDPIILQRIVDVIHPQHQDHLVEIGPGHGALTLRLLEQVHTMDAVELDRDLIAPLEQRCRAIGELRLHNADALKFDFCRLMHPGKPLRIVGNLPYNIATVLLFHLSEQMQCIRDMHFMLQKEVVDRIVAESGTSDYARLSVMIQYHCQASRLFNVGPGAFIPRPRVDSTLVRLVPHATPPVKVADKRIFSRLVTRCFSQRRKTLRNALKGTLTIAQMHAIGVDPGLRPERLTLQDFASLSNAVSRTGLSSCGAGSAPRQDY